MSDVIAKMEDFFYYDDDLCDRIEGTTKSSSV